MALPLLQLFAVFLYVVETQRDDFEDDVHKDFFPVIGFQFLIRLSPFWGTINGFPIYILHDRFVL